MMTNTVTIPELHEILTLHRKWINDEQGGVRADLRNANLRNANLHNADLHNANLEYADLRYADLSEANLEYADLRYADLRYADLRYADLSEADLRYADLRYADLRYADLSEANLSEANLREANLSEAKNIDFKIEEGLLEKVAVVALAPDALEMNSWHTCEKTHDIAGWACVLSEMGRTLEESYGAEVAGLLLLGVEAHEHFFDKNETAIEWLKTKL